MAWTNFPVVVGNPIKAVEYNELVAAADERGLLSAEDAAGWLVAEGDAISWVHISQMRTAIEGGVGDFAKYRDVDYGGDGDKWGKGTLLTHAIGQADWTDPASQIGNPIRAIHFNELYLALDDLRWLPDTRDVALSNREVRNATTTWNDSYDQRWAWVKVLYAADAWEAGGGHTAGFAGTTTDLGEPDYRATMIGYRTTDMDFKADYDCFSLPRLNYTAIISCNVWIVTKKEGQSFTPTNDFRLYEEADFAGASHAFGTGSGQNHTFNVALPADQAQLHYSLTIDPEPPTYDDYRPSPDDDYRFSWAIGSVWSHTTYGCLLYKMTFAHQT